ncbi:hypothetical protein [Pyrodictium abyssi]|uniref:Uncharacterized protein n=1 Tax=Pyrodictium abyssi TaxID=54256 RepID=A0ABM8IVZ7_9CREN|nr:hypothetical protein PABY_13000 [Pyrodictium abyssi]
MLSGCKYAIIVTEGLYDVYLLGAAVSDNYDLYYSSNIEEIKEYMWECFLDAGCIAIYPAGGIKNVRDATKEIIKATEAFIRSVPNAEVCLAVIVDSDSDRPTDRANEYYQRLWKIIQEIIVRNKKDKEVQPIQHGGKYFASLCIRRPDRPKICIASWKCSAECWIALVVPRSPITSVEYCDKDVRKHCHEVVEGELPRNVKEAGVTVVVEKVKHLIDNADPAWRAMLRELIAGIQDGLEDTDLDSFIVRLL